MCKVNIDSCAALYSQGEDDNQRCLAQMWRAQQIYQCCLLLLIVLFALEAAVLPERLKVTGWHLAAIEVRNVLQAGNGTFDIIARYQPLRALLYHKIEQSHDQLQKC